MKKNEREAGPGTVINDWMRADILESALLPKGERGETPGVCHTLFVEARGAENPYEYAETLGKWKLRLDHLRRPLVLVEGEFPTPEHEEATKAGDDGVTSFEIAQNYGARIYFPARPELETKIKNAFLALLLEDGVVSVDVTRQRAAALLSWIKRYIPALFPGINDENYPVFIGYNLRPGETGTLFLRLLSRLPCDVLIFQPEGESAFLTEIPDLLTIEGKTTMEAGKFPDIAAGAPIGTTASRAQQEIRKALYGGTEIYENQVFQDAIPLILKTTLEEIGLLWPQDAGFRPGFESLRDKVVIPLLCAKILGVPGGEIKAYWRWIKGFMKGNYLYFSDFPFIRIRPETLRSNFEAMAPQGRLYREKIRQHPRYPLKFLRKEKQDYVLDCLQKVMDGNLLRIPAESGRVKLIMSVFLNLDSRFVNLVNSQDFPKSVPKLLCLHAGESHGSPEDAAFLAFARQLGFDVVFFAPTGYQSVESWFRERFFTEHEAGPYQYQLHVPDFETVKTETENGFFRKLFRW